MQAVQTSVRAPFLVIGLQRRLDLLRRSPARSRRSCLASFTHLALVRLAYETHHVGQLIEGFEADLDVSVAPAAKISYVLTNALRVANLIEGHVDAESK